MYKDRFKHIKHETVEATRELIATKPWLAGETALSDMKAWLDKASEIYGIETPMLWVIPTLPHSGSYVPHLNSIFLPKFSVFTLLHEFRHAWQWQTGRRVSSEEDARGWSCSLVYQANPRFFNNAARKGLIFYA